MTSRYALLALVACSSQRAAPPEPIQNVPTPQAERACEDRIAGMWTARVFRADDDEWDDVTLTIARRGEILIGEILVDSWDGGADQREPPRCDDGSAAVDRVLEQATGSLRGDQFELRGHDPQRLAAPCDAPLRSNATYSADHFTGVLVPGGPLVTTNNDGDTDRGRPHVFARSSCTARPTAVRSSPP